MSASVLRSPTHTHTVRLTLHAHITLDVSHTVWLVGVCCRGPRPPHIQTHRRSMARLDKHGGEQGDGGGFTKKAGSCGGGRRKLAVPAWQKLLRAAKGQSVVSASLCALTASACLGAALCPPHPSLVSGRALPALAPISLGAPRPTQPPFRVNSPDEKTNPSVEATFSMEHSLRD